MANMRLIWIVSALINCGVKAYAQDRPVDTIGQELQQLYSKAIQFYQQDYDSVAYYSNAFSKGLFNYIHANAATLHHEFKALTDSNACKIVSSADGHFRIYSWDTWLGGTMHWYKNIYQFETANGVYAAEMMKEKNDFGAYFTEVHMLNANDKTYYLAIGGGSLSTKYAYQFMGVYTIDHDTLRDDVRLIETPEGLNSRILIEYDFFSVVDRPERPVRLIKYDSEAKTIDIPIVSEQDKISNRFIRYIFNGNYFERQKEWEQE